MQAPAKRILCYGDSNTWGYIPESGARYRRSERWPGVLAALLGPATEVFEDGLNGRTTCFDDGLLRNRNGLQTLPAALSKHRPLDIVIISLGINDLKTHLDNSAMEVAAGARKLLNTINSSSCGPESKHPQSLLISPPPVNAAGLQASKQFDQAIAQSRLLSKAYQQVARQTGALFLSGQDTIYASHIDGVHYDASQHRALAQAIADTLVSQGLLPKIKK